jgi:hypothetical protein
MDTVFQNGLFYSISKKKRDNRPLYGNLNMWTLFWDAIGAPDQYARIPFQTDCGFSLHTKYGTFACAHYTSPSNSVFSFLCLPDTENVTIYTVYNT